MNYQRLTQQNVYVCVAKEKDRLIPEHGLENCGIAHLVAWCFARQTELRGSANFALLAVGYLAVMTQIDKGGIRLF